MEFFKVQKKPKRVKARGPIEEEEILEVHAGDLKADEDCFVVNDGNAEYPVEHSVFYDTYQNAGSVVDADGWTFVRKKPVQVEAGGPIESSQVVETMEGTVKAERGDYIIRGVKGEKYPIQPDQFEELYERLE